MAIARTIAHKVFRCFWRIERWADQLTGRAGPIFVTLAAILILMAIITYFDVIFPIAFLADDTEPWRSLSALILSIYLTICSTIHYYHACTTPAGSPSEPISHQLKSNLGGGSLSNRSSSSSSSWSNLFSTCPRILRRRCGWWASKAPRIGLLKQEMIEHYRMNINRHCRKCLKNGIKGIDGRGPIKPERAHHCRICGICQLKYDHHCPWINRCVGLRNEKSFLLFLFYMTVSSAWIVVFGWPAFGASLDLVSEWPFATPRICVVLTWLLALAIGVTVGIMFGWQLLLISRGETTVESSDNEYYRKLFASRGQTYLNPFDLGVRTNLRMFFNVGLADRPGWYSLLIPIRSPPSSDGWSWTKRPGWEDQIIDLAEELTDEEPEDLEGPPAQASR